MNGNPGDLQQSRSAAEELGAIYWSPTGQPSEKSLGSVEVIK
jgi:hypothetical protein